ncbi:hypothetical protein [Meiothermus taiwanensis]|uniref:hypothetical protein n=1 Tax=Meiothermus taiwanensis TaxID=172827 RepID=UPI00041741EF
MERLDRIEAQIDDLQQELRGLRLAQSIASEELQRTLRDVRDGLVLLQARPRPPRLRVWAALVFAILGFGLGFTAHWRISTWEEVRHVQLVLPPRAPLQNLQQPTPGRN